MQDGLDGLAEPGVLERTCTSPLGFDWTVLEATVGTFMDVLIHTWDLATATSQPAGRALAFAPAGARFREWAAIPPERGRAWKRLLDEALTFVQDNA